MAPFYFIINRAQSPNTFPRVESAPSRGCHAIATASLLSRARSRQRRWMLQMLVWGRLVVTNLAMRKLPSTAVAQRCMKDPTDTTLIPIAGAVGDQCRLKKPFAAALHFITIEPTASSPMLG